MARRILFQFDAHADLVDGRGDGAEQEAAGDGDVDGAAATVGARFECNVDRVDFQHVGDRDVHRDGGGDFGVAGEAESRASRPLKPAGQIDALGLAAHHGLYEAVGIGEINHELQAIEAGEHGVLERGQRAVDLYAEVSC